MLLYNALPVIVGQLFKLWCRKLQTEFALPVILEIRSDHVSLLLRVTPKYLA